MLRRLLSRVQKLVRIGRIGTSASRVSLMLTVLFNLFRGALVGITELLPGVSGGTVALIVGIYEDLIDGAGHFVRGVVRAAMDLPRGQGLGRAQAHFRQVRWGVLIPVGIGMLGAVFTLAHAVTVILERFPQQTAAVFFGLIAASIAIPVRMSGGRWSAKLWLLAVIAAVASFLLTGIPPAAPGQPPLWIVAIAAAFAICALVLPGVSGSFLLLTVGMYQPTIQAVADRNVAYLAAFMGGAIIGLALFVQVLQWLLREHRKLTLVIMSGLMVGSLRSLWPWTTPAGGLQAPQADWPLLLALALAAAGVVVGMILIENRRVHAKAIDTPVPD